MSRPRYRVQLEGGLRLDINRLMRDARAERGWRSIFTLTWANNVTTTVTLTIQGERSGSCQIGLGDRVQYLFLEARPRHFGGHQWYFVCPITGRRASILWMPAGARSFACRRNWGRRVAYTSQFLDRTGRAHRGKAKINARLCALGRFNPDEWDLAPKPKWMRWATYNRAEEKFDRYEQILDDGLEMVALRFMAKGLAR
jgi:hypothetical protein